MKTEVLTTELGKAAAILQNGGLVAVPTETVYGLAGNGLDEAAVRRIYEVKGRPSVKPLSLMVPGAEAMERYCLDVPPAAKLLAARFWPGPLTIVLKARPEIPGIVLAGGDTVGLRCPDHPQTLALLKEAGIPFAAPSANPSGEESPKTAGQVLAYFDGKIEAVLDGGPCGVGTESTLISLAATPYRILRQGALDADVIADALADGLTVIGITGGSGSGKTTALGELARRGALVIDCDGVYHELLAHDRGLIGELETHFPGSVENGVLQRKKLGALVFSDAKALQKLNGITHRYVSAAVAQRLRDWAMHGGRVAAVDAIELIGSGLAARCDLTVGILAPEQARVERIMERDQIAREYALLRVRAQPGDAYYRENCDCVLENNGDRAQFADRFNQLIKERFPWMT